MLHIPRGIHGLLGNIAAKRLANDADTPVVPPLLGSLLLALGRTVALRRLSSALAIP